MNKEMAVAMDKWVTTQPEEPDCEECAEKYAYCYCGEDGARIYNDTIRELRSQ